MPAILECIAQANRGYIKCEEMLEIISLSLVSGLNAILYGPGGHGKSEIIGNSLDSIKGIISRTMMFGEGMDEARLYGGINLKKLNDNDDPKIEYYVKNSFLAWDYAVFEELFDAPTNVLMSLKDTLTAGAFRNGNQYEPMRTKAILCATNKEPKEVASLGASAQALLERFPIQLRVIWDSYSERDFDEMFKAQGRFGKNRSDINSYPKLDRESLEFYQDECKQVKIPTTLLHVLSKLGGQANSVGLVLSPRTMMMCQRLIQASAIIAGRNTADQTDILVIKYLPGCNGLTDNLNREITAATIKAAAIEAYNNLKDEVNALKREMSDCPNSPIKFLQIANRAEILANEIAAIKISDDLATAREQMIMDVTSVSGESTLKARQCTRT